MNKTVGEAVASILSGDFSPLFGFREGLADSWRTFSAYVSSIDWRGERFLHAVIAFHVAFLSAILLSRRSPLWQCVFFSASMLLALLASPLNSFGFSWRPDLFDSGGAFVSLVFTAPLLVCSLVAIVNMLAITGRAVAAKARLLRDREKREKSN